MANTVITRIESVSGRIGQKLLVHIAHCPNKVTPGRMFEGGGHGR